MRFDLHSSHLSDKIFLHDKSKLNILSIALILHFIGTWLSRCSPLLVDAIARQLKSSIALHNGSSEKKKEKLF